MGEGVGRINRIDSIILRYSLMVCYGNDVLLAFRWLGGRFFRHTDRALVFGLWAIGLVVLAYRVRLLARLRRL